MELDPRSQLAAQKGLGPEWTWHTPLRTDFARRQILVGCDVLAAMALGLTLEELQTLDGNPPKALSPASQGESGS